MKNKNLKRDKEIIEALRDKPEVKPLTLEDFGGPIASLAIGGIILQTIMKSLSEKDKPKK